MRRRAARDAFGLAAGDRAHEAQRAAAIGLDRLGIGGEQAEARRLDGALVLRPVAPAVLQHIGLDRLDQAGALPVPTPPGGGVKAPAVRLPERRRRAPAGASGARAACGSRASGRAPRCRSGRRRKGSARRSRDRDHRYRSRCRHRARRWHRRRFRRTAAHAPPPGSASPGRPRRPPPRAASCRRPRPTDRRPSRARRAPWRDRSSSARGHSRGRAPACPAARSRPSHSHSVSQSAFGPIWFSRDPARRIARGARKARVVEQALQLLVRGHGGFRRGRRAAPLCRDRPRMAMPRGAAGPSQRRSLHSEV